MSTFIEKERAILAKLKETDYEMFDGDEEEALNSIESRLEAFPKYANIVIREQMMMPIWKNRYEGQEYRDKIESIDASRRFAHEHAITSVNVLNRLSKSLGLEPFADIDTSDRHAVAEVVGEFVNEVYNKGIGNGFDDATYQKDKEYETSKIKEEMRKLNENYEAIKKEEEETYQNGL